MADLCSNPFPSPSPAPPTTARLAVQRMRNSWCCRLAPLFWYHLCTLRAWVTHQSSLPLLVSPFHKPAGEGTESEGKGPLSQRTHISLHTVRVVCVGWRWSERATCHCLGKTFVSSHLSLLVCKMGSNLQNADNTKCWQGGGATEILLHCK